MDCGRGGLNKISERDHLVETVLFRSTWCTWREDTTILCTPGHMCRTSPCVSVSVLVHGRCCAFAKRCF